MHECITYRCGFNTIQSFKQQYKLKKKKSHSNKTSSYKTCRLHEVNASLSRFKREYLPKAWNKFQLLHFLEQKQIVINSLRKKMQKYLCTKNVCMKTINVAKFDLMSSVVVNGVVLTFKQKRRKYPASLKKIQLITEVLKLAKHTQLCQYQLRVNL